MTEQEQKAFDQMRDALDLAMDNLRPHGDNCFLHDEGEFNACFCGKDSLVDHLRSVVESASLTAANAATSEYSEQPQYLPVGECAILSKSEPQAQGEAYSERFYGSGEDRGWWIVRGGLVKREHVAFLGESVSPEEVSKVVAELNAAHPQATE